MKYLPLTASLLALSLFAAPAMSASTAQVPAGGFVLAQATDDGADQGDGNAAVDKFLANKRPLAKIPTDRLQLRLNRAKALAGKAGISDDQRNQLTSVASAIEAELASRGGAAAGQADTGAATQQDTGGQAQPDTTQAQTKKQPPAAATETMAPASSNAEIDAYLNGATPLADMTPAQLRDRFRKGITLSKTAGISKDLRRQLRQAAIAARAALVASKGNAGKPAAGQDNANAGNGKPTSQPAMPDTGKAGTPAMEAKAKALLDDTTPAQKLSDADLRTRLQSTRELLAGNQLSPATSKALRQKLALDRRVLRSRLNNGQPGNAGNDNAANNNGGGDTIVNIKIVLNDRRPSDKLRDEELRRRIDVYREAVLNNSYGDGDRALWRQTIDSDRRILRQRLLEQRQTRKQRLASNKVRVDLNVNLQPGRRQEPSVFAAEADDADLEGTLAAAPLRKPSRRYTLDEVEQSPELRNSVARIEIDTVHFGFGESFLREEEVQNLDRIAEIMEQILASNPGEVFMVEGHTDAVGSDGANQQLSLARAKAVREALSTYYVIPPENLKPVGFGERFLKIPTPDEEPENRRVSIARITDLVGSMNE